MAETDERTSLLANESRLHYSFNSSIARERKKRIKQFQCYICALFLCFVILALIISMLFSMNEALNDIPANDTNTTNDTSLDEKLNLLMLSSWPLEDKRSDIIPSNSSQFESAVYSGKNALDQRDEIEKNTPILPVDSPSFRHQKVTSTTNKALQLSRIGYVEENGTKFIQRNMNRRHLRKICPNNASISLDEFCQNKNISCDRFEKYRSYDGLCNNLKNPSMFGTAFRPFRRTIPPDYADGISAPRVSKSGQPLPSARTVSLFVHRPYYKDDNKLTVMLAVWGQFLDHDITATALSKLRNGSSISCCINKYCQHPECFPVTIDSNDPLWKENITCMEFVRSAPAPTCCFGPREQMNQVTSFIDGSVIYGVERQLVNDLRMMRGGLLNMYVTEDNRTLLPISKNSEDGCNRKEAEKKGEYCFESGDPRSNENLHLTSMHTLWARHHNNIASQLSMINKHWQDERLFQESRKIIGAQMQHITYNEFLPILLDRKLMTKFKLFPMTSGYFQNYNDSVDPSISNHFAAAAFRFAHSIIPGIMKLIANDSSSPEYIQMHKMLFNPFKLYVPGEMDRALRGAANTNIEANDVYFTNELKQNLFERSDRSGGDHKKYGLDLVSLNIQRGRDHGLPGYIEWRKHCGFNLSQTFDDLSNDMDPSSLDNIRSLYRDVADVDLYTGALSEKPLSGGILGPTLTCLILDQFIRLKYGDRFWYENSNEVAFTPQQLDEIRKTTLAKIICNNSDNVTHIQLFVMESVRPDNTNKECDEIPGINLKYWQDDIRKVAMGDSHMHVINRRNSSLP